MSENHLFSFEWEKHIRTIWNVSEQPAPVDLWPTFNLPHRKESTRKTFSAFRLIFIQRWAYCRASRMGRFFGSSDHRRWKWMEMSLAITFTKLIFDINSRKFPSFCYFFFHEWLTQACILQISPLYRYANGELRTACRSTSRERGRERSFILSQSELFGKSARKLLEEKRRRGAAAEKESKTKRGERDSARERKRWALSPFGSFAFDEQPENSWISMQ